MRSPPAGPQGRRHPPRGSTRVLGMSPFRGSRPAAALRSTFSREPPQPAATDRGFAAAPQRCRSSARPPPALVHRERTARIKWSPGCPIMLHSSYWSMRPSGDRERTLAEFRIPNSEFRIPNSEFRNSKFKIQNSKLFYATFGSAFFGSLFSTFALLVFSLFVSVVVAEAVAVSFSLSDARDPLSCSRSR